MLGFNAPKQPQSQPVPSTASSVPPAPPAPETFEQKLESFCAAATKGREPSHGVEHMTKVRQNAEKIFDQLAASGEYPSMMNPQMRKMALAAAQFHDIADHKYVSVEEINSMGIEEEFRKYFSDKASASLMKVIDAVSFSKERKLREAANAPTVPISFVPTLGNAGSLLRDIVSDADKLEAIGSIGVKRCLQYTRESTLKKTNVEPTQDELLKELIIHGEEKLFTMLKNTYIRTSAGRAMAEPLHTSMLNEVCTMLGNNTDEIKRLHDTYDIVKAKTTTTTTTTTTTLPASSPLPNSQTCDGATPGTASSSSSTSSSSGSSSNSSNEPPKKKQKFQAGISNESRSGSYHNEGNTPVIKNGMITGITPRVLKVGDMSGN
jgi:HD superfamily phosphodiesterase